MLKNHRPLIISSLAIVVIVALYMLLSHIVRSVDGWFERVDPAPQFATLDAKIAKLSQQSSLTSADYATLFAYFVEGAAAYQLDDESHVLYPGVPGTRGLQVEGTEGFARIAPMLATWLVSGREQVIQLSSGKSFDIKAFLLNGLIKGSNPEHSGYWGDMEDKGQRIVEAADVALVYWLLHRHDNNLFSSSEQQQIEDWLTQVNENEIYHSNWILFRLIVNSVLDEFGHEHQNHVQRDLDIFKSYSVGDGWFGDGKGGYLDYYNAWQMQYFLYWFMQIKPEHDPEFLKQTFAEFSAGYRYMISPSGIPIFGRSSCYRLAVSAPLLINSMVNKQGYGEAKRSLEASLLYFIGKGSVRHGAVTQGYCETNSELLENYSGRGSCLWSLRALILAFYNSPNSAFWQSETTPLAIEQASFDVTVSGPKLRIKGDHESLAISVEQLEPKRRIPALSDSELTPMPTWRKFAEVVLRRPLRLENFEVKYGREVYYSDKPFMGCEVAN